MKIGPRMHPWFYNIWDCVIPATVKRNPTREATVWRSLMVSLQSAWVGCLVGWAVDLGPDFLFVFITRPYESSFHSALTLLQSVSHCFQVSRTSRRESKFLLTYFYRVATHSVPHPLAWQFVRASVCDYLCRLLAEHWALVESPSWRAGTTHRTFALLSPPLGQI